MKISLHDGVTTKTKQNKRTIYTQTIDAILLDKTTDPRAISRDNGRILSVDIWERNYFVAEPTILNASKVIPVDGTVRMILGLERTCHQTPQARKKTALPAP
jgi:hypothetical protein